MMLIYEPCEKYLTGTEVQNGSMVSCVVEWMRKEKNRANYKYLDI